MPARLIVVYVLMVLRVITDVVVICRSVAMDTAAQKAGLFIGSLELGCTLFVLIALAQRKYLGLQVFRVFVCVAAAVGVIGQFFSALVLHARGVEHAFFVPIGGTCVLGAALWFQAYVANPQVRAYLGATGPKRIPPLLTDEVPALVPPARAAAAGPESSPGLESPEPPAFSNSPPATGAASDPPA